MNEAISYDSINGRLQMGLPGIISPRGAENLVTPSCAVFPVSLPRWEAPNGWRRTLRPVLDWRGVEVDQVKGVVEKKVFQQRCLYPCHSSGHLVRKSLDFFVSPLMHEACKQDPVCFQLLSKVHRIMCLRYHPIFAVCSFERLQVRQNGCM